MTFKYIKWKLNQVCSELEYCRNQYQNKLKIFGSEGYYIETADILELDKLNEYIESLEKEMFELLDKYKENENTNEL